MTADYKNWIPKRFLNTLKTVFIVSTSLFILLVSLVHKINFLAILFILIFFTISTIFLNLCIRYSRGYKYFDLSKPNSLSWKILYYILDYIELNKEDATILDVGCGSGALSIACGKKFPKASILGVDIWSNMYKNYSKDLCEENARLEKVENISFAQDNAMHLSIETESFDCVISNYVYHNIKGNQKEYILDSLRVVKKGGSFAIHDIFKKEYFPDPEVFIQELKDLGFKEVNLISTAKGYPIPIDVATSIKLTHSMLLYGVK